MDDDKFKVGDKVRFKNPDSTNAKYFNKGLENLEIHRIRESYLSIWESDKSTTWGVNRAEVEPNFTSWKERYEALQ